MEALHTFSKVFGREFKFVRLAEAQGVVVVGELCVRRVQVLNLDLYGLAFRVVPWRNTGQVECVRGSDQERRKENSNRHGQLPRSTHMWEWEGCYKKSRPTSGKT